MTGGDRVSARERERDNARGSRPRGWAAMLGTGALQRAVRLGRAGGRKGSGLIGVFVFLFQKCE
jgi:hypothetical protein